MVSPLCEVVIYRTRSPSSRIWCTFAAIDVEFGFVHFVSVNSGSVKAFKRVAWPQRYIIAHSSPPCLEHYGLNAEAGGGICGDYILSWFVLDTDLAREKLFYPLGLPKEHRGISVEELQGLVVFKDAEGDFAHLR